MVRAFLHGMEPAIQYLVASVGKTRLLSLSAVDFGDLVHRLFQAIAQRTRLNSKYAAVMESDEHWASVEAGLGLALRGDTMVLQAPTLRGSEPAQERAWTAPATTTRLGGLIADGPPSG